MSRKQIARVDLDFWEYLSENAYPVTHGELRIPISLEPFVINEGDYLSVQKTLSGVVSAIRKLGQLWFESEELQEVVAINPTEKDLIVSSSDEDFIGIIRADLFYSTRPYLVEINADFPDGFFMHEVTTKAIAKNFPEESFALSSHSDLFSKLIEAVGANRESHIFIGYDKGRLFVDEFVLSKEVLSKLGYRKVSVGTFEDLKFKSNGVFFAGEKVDVIRRGAELFKLRKVNGLIERLQGAQRAGHIKVINNFKMRLLGHKSMMAALWDERFRKYLSQEEIASIEEMLPKTIKLDSIDPKKLSKNDWVLKPADLAEGDGVYVGASVSDEEWEKAISTAYENAKYWILQKRVDILDSASDEEKRDFYLTQFLDLLVTGDTDRDALIQAWKIYFEYNKYRAIVNVGVKSAVFGPLQNLITSIQEERRISRDDFDLAILPFRLDTFFASGEVTRDSLLNRLAPGDDFEAGYAYCQLMLDIINVTN